MKLIEDRIAEWREDESQGYCHAIELLCQAENELRRLRPRVSPGRPWEVEEAREEREASA